MAGRNLQWRGPEFIAAFQEAARLAVSEAAVLLQTEAKRQLGLRSSNRGKTPSPPGQPPALDTGTLRRSVQIEAPSNLRRRVGTHLFYGAIHEFGGVNHPQRPWLSVARRLSENKIRRAVAKRLKKALVSFGGP